MNKQKVKEIKKKIIEALKDKDEKWFANLYAIYLKVWNKNHKEGNPVCYEEWVDNELEGLRMSYRRYLKEAVVEDAGFDETSTENFYDFAEEEIKNPIW